MSAFYCHNMRYFPCLHSPIVQISNCLKNTRSDSEPTLATLSQGANNNNRRPSIAITRASVERLAAIWCPSVYLKNFWKLILCFVDFFVHGQIQTDVRKSILPKYDSFPLNHGQKIMFDFKLKKGSFWIQTPQRVVHTPSIFYADSFIGCLSLISSGTARKVKVGPTAAADCPPTSPLAAAWRSPLLRLEHGPQVTKSHKKSQKVKKSHKKSQKSQKVTISHKKSPRISCSQQLRCHCSSTRRKPAQRQSREASLLFSFQNTACSRQSLQGDV